MKRNEDTDGASTPPPADERVGSKPGAATEPGDLGRRTRPPERPPTRSRYMQAQRQTSTFTMPPPPIKRAPSYPDWEHPPTFYRFPRLRGNEDHRSMWPLLAVALAVVMVLIVVVVFPMVVGRGGTAAGPTGSAPAATGSVLPSASPSPSVMFSLPPGDYYDQYIVQQGDSIAKILKMYPGLLRWELLTANPQITNPNVLKAGSTINIPQHGQFDPPSATPIVTTTDAPTASPTDSPTT